VGNGNAPPEFARDSGRLLPVSRERLEDLIDNVPAIGFYIAEKGESGRWYYISPQVRDLLGYEPDEWMADRDLWYSSIHSDDKERAPFF
jgi:PAS domain-containing protein